MATRGQRGGRAGRDRPGPGCGAPPPPHAHPLQALAAEFGAFGPLQHVHAMENKSVAFVHFAWRASAEFAVEAMQGQALANVPGGPAPLAIRWAADDPHPAAAKRRRVDKEVRYEAAVRDAVNTLPADAKRARLIELHIQRTLGGAGAATASYGPPRPAYLPSAAALVAVGATGWDVPSAQEEEGQAKEEWEGGGGGGGGDGEGPSAADAAAADAAEADNHAAQAAAAYGWVQTADGSWVLDEGGGVGGGDKEGAPEGAATLSALAALGGYGSDRSEE